MNEKRGRQETMSGNKEAESPDKDRGGGGRRKRRNEGKGNEMRGRSMREQGVVRWEGLME